MKWKTERNWLTNREKINGDGEIFQGLEEEGRQAMSGRTSQEAELSHGKDIDRPTKKLKGIHFLFDGQHTNFKYETVRWLHNEKRRGFHGVFLRVTSCELLLIQVINCSEMLEPFAQVSLLHLSSEDLF